jgi:GR25 family glycosyltransferase involved in LPS biosynthesis
MVNTFANNLIDQIFYINLDHRVDRDKHMNNTLYDVLNISPDIVQRFSAIDYSKDPSFIARCIGCAQSHLEIWKKSAANKFRYIIVFEDDITPIRPIENISDDIVNLIQTYPNFNICNMAYSTHKSLKQDTVLKNLYHSSEIQTASAYILNSNFIEPLIKVTEQCIYNLSQNMDPNKNAVDQCWKILQIGNPMWFLMERSFKQIESYSDLEHRLVNYNL